MMKKLLLLQLLMISYQSVCSEITKSPMTLIDIQTWRYRLLHLDTRLKEATEDAKRAYFTLGEQREILFESRQEIEAMPQGELKAALAAENSQAWQQLQQEEELLYGKRCDVRRIEDDMNWDRYGFSREGLNRIYTGLDSLKAQPTDLRHKVKLQGIKDRFQRKGAGYKLTTFLPGMIPLAGVAAMQFLKSSKNAITSESFRNVLTQQVKSSGGIVWQKLTKEEKIAVAGITAGLAIGVAYGVVLGIVFRPANAANQPISVAPGAQVVTVQDLIDFSDDAVLDDSVIMSIDGDDGRTCADLPKSDKKRSILKEPKAPKNKPFVVSGDILADARKKLRSAPAPQPKEYEKSELEQQLDQKFKNVNQVDDGGDAYSPEWDLVEYH